MEVLERNIEIFAINLRLLCERTGSITAVCRKIGLNRQQFNKYLAGKHVPSQNNLRAIAKYFGLNASILFSSPEEFRALVEGNFFYALERLQKRQHVRTFVEEALINARTDIDDVLGVYDRYQFSSISEGQILRSAFCLYRKEDFINHYYVERFPSSENPRIADHIFKYNGFTFPVSGRIFCVDFETSQRNEMTFSSFVPIVRSSKRFMLGITSGVAANILRQPYATKVALHFRHQGLIGRNDLRRVGLMSADDLSVPKEVLSFLGGGSDMIKLQ